MIMLVIGMILVTPAMACPAGADCSQTGTLADCPKCTGIGNLSNISSLDLTIVDKNLKKALESEDVEKLIKRLASKG
ncbi:hypothetical protein [Methanosarcina spelaei]|nr:hypothetical protein [Methanosarcina spelaei]